MSGVVADVEPRHEHALRAWNGYRKARTRAAAASRVSAPEHAELAQLFVRQWVRGTRVTPAHVPRVFREDRAHVLPDGLVREHRLVEIRKARFDVHRHVHAG